MTIDSINTSTFISDTVILIRNNISTNIIDPLSSSRTGNEKFVMTSYPQRTVRYPVITVKSSDVSFEQHLGMQSELHYTRMDLEVRIWARNVKEKDELTQSVINALRNIQYSGASPTNTAKLYGYRINSTVDVDEDGEGMPKSRIINITYYILLGE